MVNAVNKIFDLPELTKSPVRNEIRVYYWNAFGSLFFRQQFIHNDSTRLDLYICSGEKVGDSLYMNIHHHVHANGIHKYAGEFNAGAIKDSVQQLEIQKEGVLDNISQFTVQVKHGNTVRHYLIDKPFTIEPQTPESRYVAKIVQDISRNFNFNFNGSVKGILDSAFLAPYSCMANTITFDKNDNQ